MPETPKRSGQKNGGRKMGEIASHLPAPIFLPDLPFRVQRSSVIQANATIIVSSVPMATPCHTPAQLAAR
jgi:hypothetical protein